MTATSTLKTIAHPRTYSLSISPPLCLPPLIQTPLPAPSQRIKQGADVLILSRKAAPLSSHGQLLQRLPPNLCLKKKVKSPSLHSLRSSATPYFQSLSTRSPSSIAQTRPALPRLGEIPDQSESADSFQGSRTGWNRTF